MKHLDDEWQDKARYLTSVSERTESELSTARSVASGASGGFIGDLAGPQAAVLEAFADSDRTLVNAVLGTADGMSSGSDAYVCTDDDNGSLLDLLTPMGIPGCDSTVLNL